jgi:hypothetical protein
MAKLDNPAPLSRKVKACSLAAFLGEIGVTQNEYGGLLQ